MAGKLIEMSHLKQILRLHIQGVPLKRICEATQIARNTVRKYVRQLEKTERSVEELLALPDEELYGLLSGSVVHNKERADSLTGLFPFFETELRRTGVNIMTLWGEYKRLHPDGYGYSRFCDLFGEWRLVHKGTMHLEHEPGDKLYIDFSGKRMSYVDALTGLLQEAEVFIATFAYSHYTYVEPIASQRKDDLFEAVCNALEYFGGSPRALVPDNLKSAVTRADAYEPVIDRDFTDLANHYGIAVLPARSRKPRDKAVVENAVSIVYSRIFAPLRNETFHSLAQLKRAVAHQLEEYNGIPFQIRQGSRRSVFLERERGGLIPLPAERFERKTYKELTVLKNCYVFLSEDKHYYSVPYRYIGRKVKVVYSARHVSVYCSHERIAYHPRNRSRSGYSTIADHLSSTHRHVSDWNRDRFIRWGAAIGQEVGDYITRILDDAPHPEQAYKSCAGILHLGRKAGRERLVKAVVRASAFHAYNYTTINNIIKSGLEDQPLQKGQSSRTLPTHDNIRGPLAYQ